MILEVFNVEHGACALVTTGNGKHFLIDCGDNASTGWEPGTVLRRRGITAIERLIVFSQKFLPIIFSITSSPGLYLFLLVNRWVFSKLAAKII